MTWRPAGQTRDDTTTFGKSAEVVIRRLGGASSKAQTSVTKAWPAAVGPELAAHTNPLSLVEGVLTVEVDDARWMTQLKWLGGRVADRINEACGNDFVERLNVRLTSSKSTK